MLTAHENYSVNRIAHKICSMNLLTENQVCSRGINFAHGESWIVLQSTCNLSMDSWHDFYLYTNCSKQRKFAHSKKNCSQKSNFLRQGNLMVSGIPLRGSGIPLAQRVFLLTVFGEPPPLFANRCGGTPCVLPFSGFLQDFNDSLLILKSAPCPPTKVGT